METRRWVNPAQPQTLYIATILLYINAALVILFPPSDLALLFGVGQAAGAFGIANEKRWGWRLATALAAVNVGFLAIAVALDPGLMFSILFLINAVFPVALFLLLVHPHGREYRQLWFR